MSDLPQSSQQQPRADGIPASTPAAQREVALVVPTDTERRLIVAKAEAEHAQALIRAFGEQVKVVVESPGVASLLQDFGKKVAADAELARERQAQEHAERMLAATQKANADARRETIGAWVVGGAAFYALIVAVGAILLVHWGVLTVERAGTVAVCLALIGKGLWDFLKNQSAPKP